MWLSKKLSLQRTAEQEGAAADMGVTTIGGANASVMTRGEQRDLPVFSPGGLIWQPRQGDTVLVVKGGMGCQERCIVAADTAHEAPADMTEGELFLYSSGGATLHLKADGSISVHGDLEMRGDLSIQGNLRLTGQVEIIGKLFVNGKPCQLCQGG